MAMAMSVSLCDLHLQNVIVHDRRPHLIDLEEALKRPMSTVKDTYLAGQNSSPLGNYHDPESPALALVGDRTSGLKVRGWLSPEDKPADCVLYLFRDGSTPAEPARVDWPEDPEDVKNPQPKTPEDVSRARDPEDVKNRRALFLGLSDVFGTLTSEPCFSEVKTWVEDLGQTIARYVPRGTAGFADNCRTLYKVNCRTAWPSTPSGRQPDSWYDKVVSDVQVERSTGALAYSFFFRDQVNNQRGVAKADPWPGPVFALEHPDHAWRDFLNCDVPSFYHFLGEQDLRDSAGNVVNVNTAVQWQAANITGPAATPAGWRADPQGHYLPQVPTDVVKSQLGWLKSVWGLTQQLRASKDERGFCGKRSTALIWSESSSACPSTPRFGGRRRAR